MSFRTTKLISGQKILPSLAGKIQILIAIALFSCLPSRANTITAASCSLTDVQAAVNSAANGDTVRTPGPCAVSWSGTVAFPSTVAITVDGGGNTTISSSHAFDVRSTATGSSRLTGFTFTNSGSGDLNDGDVRCIGSSTYAPFRIDHNTFPSVDVVIVCYNNAPGLIDHNTFTLNCGAETIHNMAKGASNNAGWQDDVTPGSAAMLFVEDNSFTALCPGGTAMIEAYYGARTVIRYNSLYNGAYIDEHGTAGNVGARWWEIYDNTFYPNGLNVPLYMQIRAGSGLIFDNHIVGTTTGAGSLEFWEEDTGTWPLAYQIGSGINGYTNQHNTCASGTLNSNPAYLWGNDAGFHVYGTPGTLIQQNRDYFIYSSQPSPLPLIEERSTDTCSTTFAYTPYTYPHPLQGQGQSQGPQPPTGLSAVAQ